VVSGGLPGAHIETMHRAQRSASGPVAERGACRALEQEGDEMEAGRTRTEEFQVAGGELMDRLKAIVREGRVRRVVIRNPEGRTLLDIPLAAGVVGAALMPFWAAVGSIAAIAARYTIVVEREVSDDLTSSRQPPGS
jgi:hypothetical protein